MILWLFKTRECKDCGVGFHSRKHQDYCPWCIDMSRNTARSKNA